MYPACFESQQQYDDWLKADRLIYAKIRDTAFCIDCTPSYATAMRSQGRCEHPEVKFYRKGTAFMGEVGGYGARESVDKDWEPVSESETKQSNGKVARAHA